MCPGLLLIWDYLYHILPTRRISQKAVFFLFFFSRQSRQMHLSEYLIGILVRPTQPWYENICCKTIQMFPHPVLTLKYFGWVPSPASSKSNDYEVREIVDGFKIVKTDWIQSKVSRSFHFHKTQVLHVSERAALVTKDHRTSYGSP